MGRVRDEPNIRVMAHVKSSLAPEGVPIAFEFDDNNGFHWIGEYDIDIQELLHGASTSESVLARAEKLIEEMLADQPVLSDDLFTKAKEERISVRTLKTAKKKLGVKSIKTIDGWKWCL